MVGADLAVPPTTVRGRGDAAELRFRFDVRASPWSPAIHVVGILFLVSGAVLAVLSWYHVSGRETFREQAGWVVLSVAAGGLFAMAFAVWLLGGLRAVRAGQREFLAELRRERESRASARVRAGEAGAGELVTAAGMTRYHRVECRLLRNKATVPVRAGADLRPCGVCEP